MLTTLNNVDLAQSYAIAGKTYGEHQQFYSAIVSYEKSLQINPHQAEVWHELGLLYCDLDRYQDGIICYLEALLLDIDSRFCQSLSAVLLQIGRITDAEDASADIISNKLLMDFYPLPSDWQLKFALDRDKIHGQHEQVHPPTVLELTPPVNLDNSSLTFLRKQVDFPAATLTIIPQGKVIARHWASAITTPENYLLPEVSTGLSNWLFLQKNQPPLQTISGRVVVLARWGGLKYYHWLGEVFSTCYLLSLGGLDLAEIDYFLVNSPMPEYQREMLAYLGITAEKILESEMYPYIQAEELIFPYYGDVDGWFPALAVDFLKQLFLPQRIDNSLNNSPKKIYLSRDRVSYRKVINEPEVRELLAAFGFVTIIPETLSFTEQVALFSQAEVIVSPHGAGLANLIFCPPGVKVIELFTTDYVYGCFWAIASQVGLNYYYLINQTSQDQPPELIHPCYRDIYVDIPQLKQLLEI